MNTEVNKQIVKQARWLTQALLLSGALNIGLLLAFFCLFAKEHITNAAFEHKPIEQIQDVSALHFKTNGEVIKLFEKLSFEQLIARLDQKDLVEDGFAERDLALGLLVSSYHFNLAKALTKDVPESRTLIIERGSEMPPLRVSVFPGLSEEDFRGIDYFAKREKWPLTTQGLFVQLQGRNGAKEIDPALLETFYLSSEFKEVETLFSRHETIVDKADVLKVVLDGDFAMLTSFEKSQKEALDLSISRHQRFLLDYVARGSKSAAEIMLRTHGAFAVKKLDDAHVIALLQLLNEKTAHSEAFAKALLISPRSDSVWKLAAYNLYKFSGEEIKGPYDHMEALNRFIPQEVITEKANVAKAVVNKTTLPQSTKTATQKTKVPLIAVPRTHVVQEGETLWVIAKKYKTDIAALKKLNDLKTDTIRKGKSLKLPAEKK